MKNSVFVTNVPLVFIEYHKLVLDYHNSTTNALVVIIEMCVYSQHSDLLAVHI